MIITGMDHFQSVCKKKLVVSIHPSAREVTTFASESRLCASFQSTLPQGK